MTNEFLPYSQARDLIQNGDIIFLRKRRGLIHHTISWFTKSSHIHVGIAFWADIHGGKHLMISEANMGTQRRIVNLSHYKDHDMDVLVCPTDWNDICARVTERIGEVQYNWVEAGYVGISELFRRSFGIELPKIEFPGEICSEFVANILNIPHNYLSPAELYNYMQSNGIQLRVQIRG